MTGPRCVVISHDLAVVHQISDDAIVMSGGRVVERGPTAQLLRAPGTDCTKALPAAVPHPGWKPHRKPPLKRRRWATRPLWSLR
ncbi:hypothetical protein ACIQZB_38775 [Streptomyces sp. NPDC097727]|uniref:hypothetical protein n=1 Tax=Streptomyces sp. NPDC097727 TaxID=3366092 RepID=UPI003800FA01